MRGGCKDFFLRRFVLSGPEVLKIEFSYRQWIDIHTKKKPKSKSHSETEISSHLRKIHEFSMILASLSQILKVTGRIYSYENQTFSRNPEFSSIFS